MDCFGVGIGMCHRRGDSCGENEACESGQGSCDGAVFVGGRVDCGAVGRADIELVYWLLCVGAWSKALDEMESSAGGMQGEAVWVAAWRCVQGEEKYLWLR